MQKRIARTEEWYHSGTQCTPNVTSRVTDGNVKKKITSAAKVEGERILVSSAGLTS